MLPAGQLPQDRLRSVVITVPIVVNEDHGTPVPVIAAPAGRSETVRSPGCGPVYSVGGAEHDPGSMLDRCGSGELHGAEELVHGGSAMFPFDQRAKPRCA